MITNISQGVGGTLQELFRSLQKEQEEVLEKSTTETLNAKALETANIQPAAASQGLRLLLGRRLDTASVQPAAALDTASVQPAAASVSSNLMSRNFFNYDYERSEYLQANIDGKQLEGSFANKMNSLLNSLTSQAAIWDMERNFGGAVKIENTYVIGTRLATASAQATNRIKQEETSEASEKNLDEIKDEIESKAQEAAEPTDADVNPAESLPVESAGEIAPIQEISDSNSVSASDVVTEVAPVGVTAATSASIPATTLVENATPAVPVAPSIDITV